MKNRYLLRVISGKYRGKGILSPKDFSVRPTSQRVKESLFNIIRTDIYGKNFLDVFSGTGQIGIEAVSNGANVTFVDIDTKLLRENTSEVLKNETVEICSGKFANVFESFSKINKKFDFIFADPPYNDGLYDEIIKYSLPILSEDGMLILEHSSDLTIEHDNVFDKRVYGSRALTFIGGNK